MVVVVAAKVVVDSIAEVATVVTVSVSIKSEPVVQPPTLELLVWKIDNLTLVATLVAHPLENLLVGNSLWTANLVDFVWLASPQEKSSEDVAAVLTCDVGARLAMGVDKPTIAAEFPGLGEESWDVICVEKGNILLILGLNARTDKRSIANPPNSACFGSVDNGLCLTTPTLSKKPRRNQRDSLGALEDCFEAVDVVVSGDLNFGAFVGPRLAKIGRDGLFFVGGEDKLIAWFGDLCGEAGCDSAKVTVCACMRYEVLAVSTIV
ncbi:hypothetical protein HG530_000245 [Fusarium avenaceum]|nr:hypothetical protein HG530_000245 [Fusarium avenaceum]